MEHGRGGRSALDLCMVALLLAALAYRLTGNAFHEWAGLAFLTLLLIHILQHRRWRWMTAMNALLFAAAGVLLGSALFLSHDLFAFLGLNGGMKAHTLHLSAAYWVLVLSGIHMGLHWEKIAGRLRGRKGARPASFLIALYGMYAFWKREVGYKLIGSYSFDFWDYDKPAVFFFLDCLAIMGACIWMTRYARGLSKRMRGA